MTATITKEELNKFMQIEGEVRGLSFFEDKDYILKKKGEKGLEKIQDIITKSGSDFEFKKIKRMEMYPLGLQALILEAIKRGFQYTEEDFQEMGIKEAKSSPLIRIFIKYFVSLEKLIPVVSRMWRMYFSVGDLEVEEINRKEKHIILRIKNWKLSPHNCQILKGYLSTLLKMIVNTPVSAEERKCFFRGDNYHEYVLSWGS